MSVPQASVVVGHSDEVVATGGLLAGHVLPQQEAREVQVPATGAAHQQAHQRQEPLKWFPLTTDLLEHRWPSETVTIFMAAPRYKNI